MRSLRKTAASALIGGILLLCLRVAPAFSDTLSEAMHAYATADYAKAFPLFQELASEPNPEARFYLGSMMMLGQGTPKDTGKGLVLVRSAANAGVPEAQYLMGYFYENGSAVPADPVEALTWYNVAAQHGSLKAEARLGVIAPTMAEDEVKEAADRASNWKPVPLQDLPNP